MCMHSTLPILMEQDEELGDVEEGAPLLHGFLLQCAVCGVLAEVTLCHEDSLCPFDDGFFFRRAEPGGRRMRALSWG